MKISNINSYTFNPYSNLHSRGPKQAPQNTLADTNTTLRTNPATTLINFNGGASLNLKSTIKNLETLGEKFNKIDTIFPPKVKENASAILEAGNPQNQRLIDIHKDIFGKLKDCETLSEVKSLFSKEKFFDDVISDSEATFTEGSFADKVKKGENSFFNKDEDLSVQLIKLYWGEGFSLNDLKTYTDGKNVDSLLNKLNIPKRDRHYGAYLKLSDEEYNLRITREMAEKRLETLDRKIQAEEGEPVYISSRRHHSEETKQLISEKLIQHYLEHPEACYKISKRQRAFYEQNPDQKLIFTEVLNRAWNLRSAEGIKSALKKHLSKQGRKDFSLNLLNDPMSMSEKQSHLMQGFWEMNEWAKKTHSKNMNYAWRIVKEEYQNPPVIFNFPLGMIQDMIKFGRERGTELSVEDFLTKYNTVTKKHIYDEKFFKVFKEFTDDENNADTIATLYQYSLVKSIQNMTANVSPQNFRQRKQLLDILVKKYQPQIYELEPKTGKIIRFKNLNIDESRTIFTNVQLDLQKYAPDLEEVFIAQLTEDYPIVKAEVLKSRK